MPNSLSARIPCTSETRDLVRAQKRDGESYDILLQKMVDQYNPEKARENGEQKD